MPEVEHYLLSTIAAAAVLVILWVFPTLEEWIDNTRHTRTYEVTCEPSAEALNELERLFKEPGLSLRGHKRVKAKDCLVLTWSISGSPGRHDQLVEKLMDHPKVRELQF